jgi:paraquat-inducible protein A
MKHLPSNQTIHCHYCGSHVADCEVPRGSVLMCGLCGSKLKFYRRADSYEVACALALTSLTFLVLALANPVMTFVVAGNEQSNFISTGIWVLVTQGYWPIAVLVVFCAVVAPGIYLIMVAYSSAACFLSGLLPGSQRAVALAQACQPWSLVPVFAAACLVSAVKLEHIGQVEWRVGVWWVVALSVNTLILGMFFDPGEAGRSLRAARVNGGSP